MKEQWKDPFLWAGFDGLLYQILSVKGFIVPQGLWDLGMNLLSYLCIGVSVVGRYQGGKKHSSA